MSFGESRWGDWTMPIQLMSLTFLVIQLGEGRGIVYLLGNALGSHQKDL